MGDAEYLAAFRTIVLPVARSALSITIFIIFAFMIFQFVPSVSLLLSSIASVTDILASGIMILVILMIPAMILIMTLTTIFLMILIIIVTSGTLPRTSY